MAGHPRPERAALQGPVLPIVNALGDQSSRTFHTCCGRTSSTARAKSPNRRLSWAEAAGERLRSGAEYGCAVDSSAMGRRCSPAPPQRRLHSDRPGAPLRYRFAIHVAGVRRALLEAGIAGSISSVGGALDNALMKSTIAHDHPDLEVASVERPSDPGPFTPPALWSGPGNAGLKAATAAFDPRPGRVSAASEWSSSECTPQRGLRRGHGRQRPGTAGRREWP
jgi:hypothetical protein